MATINITTPIKVLIWAILIVSLLILGLSIYNVYNAQLIINNLK